MYKSSAISIVVFHTRYTRYHVYLVYVALSRVLVHATIDIHPTISEATLSEGAIVAVYPRPEA